MRILVILLFFHFELEARIYTDTQLNALLRSTPQGIIYLWSPHMPYSMTGIKTIETVALKMRLPLLILLDPHADARAASEAVKRLQLKRDYSTRLESRELFRRNITTQFPSVVVFKDGRLRGGTIPGVKSEQHYRALIRTQLNR